jgi:hypothetical protein
VPLTYRSRKREKKLRLTSSTNDGFWGERALPWVRQKMKQKRGTIDWFWKFSEILLAESKWKI